MESTQMEDFSNSVLLPENLPELKPEDFKRLDRKYLKVIFIRIFMLFLALVAGFVAILILPDEVPPVLVLIGIAAVMVLLLAYSIAISILGFPRKGYLLREKDVSFKRGLLVFKSTTVPFNRIQHVEVNQGVLAKMFHLSAVKIYTAGGTSSDLSIPGLPLETAQKLKAFLSEKISEHE